MAAILTAETVSLPASVLLVLGIACAFYLLLTAVDALVVWVTRVMARLPGRRPPAAPGLRSDRQRLDAIVRGRVR